MLTTSLIFSLLPLVIDKTHGAQTPFLFNAIFRAGASAACLVFFLSFHRRTLLDPSTLRAIGKRITRWPENRPLILATIGSMDYAAFVWSVQYLHITVAAVLYETGPIATIFVIAWLFRKNDRYRKITPLTLALVLMSMAGFLMSVLSQSDDSGLFKSLFNWNSAAGITLVITATLLSSITAFGFRWGTELSRKLAPGEEEKSRELCFVVLAFFVASVVVAAFQHPGRNSRRGERSGTGPGHLIRGRRAGGNREHHLAEGQFDYKEPGSQRNNLRDAGVELGVALLDCGNSGGPVGLPANRSSSHNRGKPTHKLRG